MQREKLYNLHKTTCFIVALSVFKMNKLLRDQISGIAKIGRTEFFFFENNYIKLCCEDFRAFHAAYCGVFLFSFDKAYQVMKRWNDKK
jgi:hypothetical protein